MHIIKKGGVFVLKKILSLVLSVLMLLTCFSVGTTAFAKTIDKTTHLTSSATKKSWTLKSQGSQYSIYDGKDETFPKKVGGGKNDRRLANQIEISLVIKEEKNKNFPFKKERILYGTLSFNGHTSSPTPLEYDSDYKNGEEHISFCGEFLLTNVAINGIFAKYVNLEVVGAISSQGRFSSLSSVSAVGAREKTQKTNSKFDGNFWKHEGLAETKISLKNNKCTAIIDFKFDGGSSNLPTVEKKSVTKRNVELSISAPKIGKILSAIMETQRTMKHTGQAQGYEVQYWSVKGKKWKTIKKFSKGGPITIKKKVPKKDGNIVCFRFRTYNKQSGKKIYSRWVQTSVNL